MNGWERPIENRCWFFPQKQRIHSKAEQSYQASPLIFVSWDSVMWQSLLQFRDKGKAMHKYSLKEPNLPVNLWIKTSLWWHWLDFGSRLNVNRRMIPQWDLKPDFKRSRPPTDPPNFHRQTHGDIREKLAHHLYDYFIQLRCSKCLT